MTTADNTIASISSNLRNLSFVKPAGTDQYTLNATINEDVVTELKGIATSHWTVTDLATNKPVFKTAKRVLSTSLPAGKYRIAVRIKPAKGGLVRILLGLVEGKSKAKTRSHTGEVYPHFNVDNKAAQKVERKVLTVNTAPKQVDAAAAAVKKAVAKQKVDPKVVKALAGRKASPKVKKGLTTMLKDAGDMADIKNGASPLANSAIAAFEADVLKHEGIRITLTPIAGQKLDSAIKKPYSDAFRDSLTGKHSVVKQLIARISQVIDAQKLVLSVFDQNGKPVSPGATLSKIRVSV